MASGARGRGSPPSPTPRRRLRSAPTDAAPRIRTGEHPRPRRPLPGDFLGTAIDAPPVLSVLVGRVWVHVVGVEIELLQDTFCEGLVVPSGSAILDQLLQFVMILECLLGSRLEPLNRVEIVARAQRNIIISYWDFFCLLLLILLAPGGLSAFIFEILGV